MEASFIRVLIILQDNNLERAADWVFSHAAELDAPMETDEPPAGSQTQYRDGNGSKYCGFLTLKEPITAVRHNTEMAMEVSTVAS